MEVSITETEVRKMDNHIYDKLRGFRLKTMANEYMRQDDVPGITELTFDQRLGLLVDAEADARDSARLKKRIKEAKFAEPGAAIESIRYYPDRKLNRELFTQLATNRYIYQPKNVLIVGATGCGKSYLACALGNRACQENYKVRYIRLPDLFTELEIGKLEHTYDKLLKRLHTRDLLIIDEWLLYPLTETQRQSILEVIEGRYRHRATIICSQYDPDGWHEILGGGPIADAIMDRLKPKSETIHVGGKLSMRVRES